MMFSDNTNLTGIVEDIDFRCSTTVIDYPLKDKARNINQVQDGVLEFLMENSKKIEWADTALTAPYNYTDYNLVDTEIDVTVTVPYKFQRAEIKDSNGDWTEIKLINREELKVAKEEFESTDGIPKFLTINGDNAQLFPAPDYTQASSLRIYDQPEVTLFVSTDTTKTPLLPRFSHSLLSVGASIMYCNLYKKDRVQVLVLEQDALYARLGKWLFDRDKEQIRMISGAESSGDSSK